MSQPNHGVPIHVNALLAADRDGPLWSTASEQINANLIRLSTGQGMSRTSTRRSTCFWSRSPGRVESR